MPYINAKFSEKLDTGATERLKEAFGKAIELIPGKTERWLMLNFDSDGKMAFAGTFGKCAMLEVEIFGAASDSAYAALTRALCDAVHAETGIPADRIYVKYAEVCHWGCGGVNF